MQYCGETMTYANTSPGPRRWLMPVGAGLLGSLALMAIYVGLIALAESPARALEQWWQDRVFVLPILAGFGIQVGLYTVLRRGLYLPHAVAQGGATTAASGGVSTLAMAACCAHRVADVLPFVGLSAAATVLAGWKEPLLWLAVLSNAAGVAVLAVTIARRRRLALRPLRIQQEGS